MSAPGLWEDRTSPRASAPVRGRPGAPGVGPAERRRKGTARPRITLSRPGLLVLPAPGTTHLPPWAPQPQAAHAEPCAEGAVRVGPLLGKHRGIRSRVGGAVTAARPSSLEIRARPCEAAGPGPACAGRSRRGSQGPAFRRPRPRPAPDWEALVRNKAAAALGPCGVSTALPPNCLSAWEVTPPDDQDSAQQCLQVLLKFPPEFVSFLLCGQGAAS